MKIFLNREHYEASPRQTKLFVSPWLAALVALAIAFALWIQATRVG